VPVPLILINTIIILLLSLSDFAYSGTQLVSEGRT